MIKETATAITEGRAIITRWLRNRFTSASDPPNGIVRDREELSRCAEKLAKAEEQWKSEMSEKKPHQE